MQTQIYQQRIHLRPGDRNHEKDQMSEHRLIHQHSVADKHAGRLKCKPAPGQGTELMVESPVQQKPGSFLLLLADSESR